MTAAPKFRVDPLGVFLSGSAGETIEFTLSPERDPIAATLFLRLALSRGGIGPPFSRKRVKELK